MDEDGNGGAQDTRPAAPDPTTLDEDAPGSDMGAGWQEAADSHEETDDEGGMPGIGDVYRSGS